MLSFMRSLADTDGQKNCKHLVNTTAEEMEKNNSARKAALQDGRLNLALGAASGAEGKGSCKKQCVYFRLKDSCKFGDTCHASHDPISAEMKKGFRLPSRSPSPAADRGKGKAGDGASAAGRACGYCKFCLKGERKRRDDCIFAHVAQDSAGAVDRAHAKAKAQRKAKAKEKAKADGRPIGKF